MLSWLTKKQKCWPYNQNCDKLFYLKTEKFNLNNPESKIWRILTIKLKFGHFFYLSTDNFDLNNQKSKFWQILN